MAQKDCPLCQGTGWRLVDVAGVSRAQRCDCGLARQPLDLLRRSRIPPRYQKASFETFEFVNKPAFQLVHAWNTAKQYVEEWVPTVEYGLAFIGPPGVGKTHLAVSVIRELIVQKGVDCLFVDFRELLQRIRNSYKPETEATEEDLLTPVVECDLLLLDELVAAKPSEWVKERLAYIINARYNAKQPTIITTTLELSNSQDDRSPGVGEVDDASIARQAREKAAKTEESRPRSLDELHEFGRQIASRFFEMCKPIEIHASDYRKTVKRALTNP